jgi:hypothetical protein
MLRFAKEDADSVQKIPRDVGIPLEKGEKFAQKLEETFGTKRSNRKKRAAATPKTFFGADN